MSNKQSNKTTITEVAQLADVSITTVSHYLNGTKSVSKKAQKRIQDAIKELHYLPNANARSLKRQRTHRVGVIIPDMSIYGYICQYTEMFLYEHNYNVIICNTCSDPIREHMQLKALIEQRVDGIIIATSGGNDDFILNIHESGTPIILIDRYLPQLPDLNYVLEKSDECITKIMEYVIKMGHKKIAYMKGPGTSIISESRFKTFKEILHRHEIEECSEFYYSNLITRNDCMEALDHLFAHKDEVSVVITTNANQIKYFAMRAHEKGIRIPDEMSFTGFGNDDYKTLLTFPITCIIQNYYEIAVHSARLILELIASQGKNKEPGKTQQIYVESEFFIGDSVRNLHCCDHIN